jgi:integrase
VPVKKKEIGDNVWLVTLNSYDDNGHRHRKQLRVKGEKKAERERQRLEREFALKTLVRSDRSVLSELLDAWLEAAQEELKTTTVGRYRDLVKLHITLKLGDKRLDWLQKHPDAIRDFLIERHKHGGRNGRELAPMTVVHIYRCLHTALEWACEDGKLSSNPAHAPSVRRLARAYMRQAEGKFEPTVMDAEEMRQLLEASRGTDLFLPILLAVSTGLRRGEVLGLRWRDVDLKAGVLEVRHTLQQTRDAGVFEGTPKSRKSRRGFALPAFAVQELRREWARLGNGADADRYICADICRTISPAASRSSFVRTASPRCVSTTCGTATAR